jgi:hypothetical protein
LYAKLKRCIEASAAMSTARASGRLAGTAWQPSKGTNVFVDGRGKQTGELTSARRLAPTRRPPRLRRPRRRVHAARRPRFPAPVSHVAKPQQGASTWGGVPALLCGLEIL